MKDQPFIIQDINGFKVVRDDLFEGGTKRRAFAKLIESIKENELVYACDYFGYAAYAIALTAQETGKKVTLFYCSPKHQTDVFNKTVSIPNVNYKIIETASTQMEVAIDARDYADANGAHFLPVGLDFPEFRNELTKIVKSADIQAPEIWCLGASGTLGRSLQQAYPNIPVNMVNLGTADFNAGRDNIIYDAPEAWDEEAQIKPPYSSSQYLDAKVWRFVLKHAKPGSYIWNVA